MSKKKQIAALEQQIADLESALEAKNKPPVEKPRVKTKGKTGINIYMDSDFFKPLIGNDKERVVIKERHEVTTHGRPQSRKITSVKGKKPSRFGANLWKFIKGFLKVLFVLLIVALIVALVALIGLAIVWALVNFNVITTTQNGFIATSWGIIEKLFALFGYQVPMI